MKRGRFLKDMSGMAWMCDVGQEFNSIVEIDWDSSNHCMNLKGPAILYGLIAYCNHRCGPSLGLGLPIPGTKHLNTQHRQKRFSIPLTYTKPINMKWDDQTVVYHKGEQMFINYASTKGFICHCGFRSCKS